MVTLKDQVLASALPAIPFEGWSMTVLETAAEKAGLHKQDAHRAFPGGIGDCLDYFIASADARMSEALKGYNLDTMKIRERIATAVRVRLDQNLPHREAIRRAVTHRMFSPVREIGSLYRTVDAIWRAAGDTSTDFNFYTKRLMLAKVYASTLLFWLDDKTPGQQATQAFLARRIENVMQFEKFKSKLKSALKMG